MARAGMSLSKMLRIQDDSWLWRPAHWFSRFMTWINARLKTDDSVPKAIAVLCVTTLLVLGIPAVLGLQVALHFGREERKELVQWWSTEGVITDQSGVADDELPQNSNMTATYLVGGESRQATVSLPWDTKLGSKVRLYYLPGEGVASLDKPVALWDAGMNGLFLILGFFVGIGFLTYVGAAPPSPRKPDESTDQPVFDGTSGMSALTGSELLADPAASHLS